MKLYSKVILTLKAITIIFLSAQESNARWSNYEDAAVEYTLYNVDVTVNANGTTDRVVELEMKLLKDSAREMAAHYSLIYNSDSSKLTILDARTIYKDKTYNVGKNLIEDKTVASSVQGFDAKRQVMIAYPKIEVGSKIYVKYRLTENKPTIDGVFSEQVFFGVNGYWNHAKLRFTSKLPLNVQVNDPNNVLKVTEKNDKTSHFLEVTLTTPFTSDYINEPDNGVVNEKKLTWVSLSSLTEWNELAKILGNDYTRVVNQPLPPEFEEIVKTASAIEEEDARINHVTSMLNEKIQYMGDWRNVSGRLIPRDLVKIAETQMGDCKDFASATAAILNKLNFKAQVAAVRRGELDPSSENTLPSIGNYNHVLVKVTNANNKVKWIDPTNFASMSDGIFPDVANKDVLILDQNEPGKDKIPSIDHKHSGITHVHEIKLRNETTTSNEGNYYLKGESAIGLVGAALHASKQSIEDSIYYYISNTQLEAVDKKGMTLPDLTSRSVRDINFSYLYEQHNKLVKTNLGKSFSLSGKWVNDFSQVAPDQVSDLFVDIPRTLNTRTIIRNALAHNLESLNFESQTKWLSVRRSCRQVNSDIIIDDTVEVYLSFIPNEDLKTQEFISLKKSIEQNFKNSAIVFVENIKVQAEGIKTQPEAKENL